MMKIIPTRAAIGLTLAHDITQIQPSKSKKVRFPKGHIVTAQDIPVLLALGKEHLYVPDEHEEEIHEEAAAAFLFQIAAGEHLRPTEVAEGKIQAVAQVAGVLKVDRKRLNQVNAIEGLAVATKFSNQKVLAGEKVAGFRIIPLTIAPAPLHAAETIVGVQPLIEVKPFKKMKVGIVTTGSEVYHGLVPDGFLPVLKTKFTDYPTAKIVSRKLVMDQVAQITAAIQEMLRQGIDLILCTGGMSVDPDDCTPLAIRQTKAEIITHGTPVLPGSMLLLAYVGHQAIVGLPGGVLFARRTVFDLLLPRLMAGERITKSEIIALGYGGYQ